MKQKKKISIIVIISISILFSLLTGKNYAANETTNNKTTEKSSNANLSDLGITPYDFKGFKYGTTYYEVSVPEDTEEVEVYAKTQDSNAQLTGTGKKKLQKGENKAEVTVIAEDGNKKTYTINIIREIQQGQEKDTEEDVVNIEDSNGLLELKIEDLVLTPEFATDVYEYTVKYIGEETKLNIETKATNIDYIVEVTGNNDLQEGENIITILVSEEDGENVATYQITLNKSLIDYEAIAKEEAKKQKIIIGSIAVVIVAVIVVIIIKSKRNKEIENEFFVDSSYEDDKEKYDEELPRALNKNEKQAKMSLEFEEDVDEIEELPKEVLKERFLNNYSNHQIEDYGEIKERKSKKSKGKRYK